jgi:hypothetical protein
MKSTVTSKEATSIDGVADELYEMRKNNDETLFQLKNIAGSLDLISQYLYDISWELKKSREEKIVITKKDLDLSKQVN